MAASRSNSVPDAAAGHDIRCIFFSEFHATLGPQLVYQVRRCRPKDAGQCQFTTHQNHRSAWAVPWHACHPHPCVLYAAPGSAKFCDTRFVHPRREVHHHQTGTVWTAGFRVSRRCVRFKPFRVMPPILRLSSGLCKKMHFLSDAPLALPPARSHNRSAPWHASCALLLQQCAGTANCRLPGRHTGRVRAEPLAFQHRACSGRKLRCQRVPAGREEIGRLFDDSGGRLSCVFAVLQAASTMPGSSSASAPHTLTGQIPRWKAASSPIP